MMTVHQNKHNLLLALKLQIEKLENQIDLATQNKSSKIDDFDFVELHFDEHLFTTNKKITSYVPYIEQAKQTFQSLERGFDSDNLEKIEYLSERLLNQLTALTREFATKNLRYKEPPVQQESLSEKHSRHLEYLRRLQDIKFELELDEQSSDYTKIAAIDNRIDRCQKAIKKLELQMEDDSN